MHLATPVLFVFLHNSIDIQSISLYTIIKERKESDSNVYVTFSPVRYANQINQFNHLHHHEKKFFLFSIFSVSSSLDRLQYTGCSRTGNNFFRRADRSDKISRVNAFGHI